MAAQVFAKVAAALAEVAAVAAVSTGLAVAAGPAKSAKDMVVSWPAAKMSSVAAAVATVVAWVAARVTTK